MKYTTLKSIQSDLYEGKITCRQLVEFYLKNIEEKNNKLNAFLSVFREESLLKADEIDLKIKNKSAGKLVGMVLGIKDLLCYKNHISQAGSRILEGFESQFNATAVQRVLDELLDRA